MSYVFETNKYYFTDSYNKQRYIFYRLTLDIVEQNVAKNQTTLDWQYECVCDSSTAWVAEYGAYCSLWPFPGSTTTMPTVFFYSTDRVQRYKGILANGTITIPHNSSGEASVQVDMYGYPYSSSNKVDYVGIFSLPTLFRETKLTAVPNFNDEENPTISYECPIGEQADAIMACISLDGSLDTVPFRDIPKATGSYTFELTEDERNALRNGTNTSDSKIVYFSIMTAVGSDVYYSKATSTFTVINAEPTLSPTVEDVDEIALMLTGDKNTIVRNISDVQFNSGAAAKKGATIASQTVTCGAQSVTNETGAGSFSNVDSDTFVFTMVDSRGKRVSQTVTKTLIPYIDLSCSIVNTGLDGNGNFTFTVRGGYYNGGFGAVYNQLTVQYRYREDGGVYSDWANMDYGYDSNEIYHATKKFEGLNYQTRYAFQARVQDKYHELLGTWIETPVKYVQGLPIFDWSQNDFNFNVPVTIQGGSVDTIIEQGFEDGWYYKKWASGLAECAYTYTGKVSLSNNLAGVYYTPSITVDYPFDFVSTPVVTVSGGSHSTINWARTFGADANGAGFTVIGNTEQPDVDVVVHIQVYGKWR